MRVGVSAGVPAVIVVTRRDIVAGPRLRYRSVAQYVPYTRTNSVKKEARGIPTPEEDKEVMHEAFLHAFEISRPEQCRIPGMQEFASAILAREKIPSQQYSDPLGHIFDEVDANGDAVLSASEVGQALRSHDVEITDDQVSMFMKALNVLGSSSSSDATSSKKGASRERTNGEVSVEKKDFRDLIVHMAAADFQCTQLCDNAFDSQSVTSCTFESDDDVQRTLETWRTGLLHSGVIPTANVSMSTSESSSSGDDSSSSSVDE